MASVNVTELKNRATQILRRVERGDEYVVTKRGRPIAVLLPAALEELEDWVLAHHPEARRRQEEAAARISAGDHVALSELRRRVSSRARRRRT